MRLAILIVALCASPVLADGAEETGPWSGSAGLGFASASGNSETATTNADLAVGYTIGSWEHSATALAFAAINNDATDAERYAAGWLSRYSFTEFDYVFGRLSFDKDRFSGLSRQISETVGYGRRILNSDVHVLNAEVGVGARQSELNDGTKEDEFITRLAGDYTWTFSETSSFRQTLGIDIGSSNTFTESVSAVNARLVGMVSLVLAYTIRNNSSVPAGSDKTDTLTTINLRYDF